MFFVLFCLGGGGSARDHWSLMPVGGGGLVRDHVSPTVTEGWYVRDGGFSHASWQFEQENALWKCKRKWVIQSRYHGSPFKDAGTIIKVGGAKEPWVSG